MTDRSRQQQDRALGTWDDKHTVLFKADGEPKVFGRVYLDDPDSEDLRFVARAQ